MGNIITTANCFDVCDVAVRTRRLGWSMPFVAADASTYAVKHHSPGSRLSPDST
jgi:hypothetical protein